MSTDLSTLSLFRATPEQAIETRRRTLNEWGKGLTLEEHLDRDASQEDYDCSRDGRFSSWVLAPREDPQTLEFKCACETFKRTGLVVDPTKSKSAEVVTCYGVASVFTPAANRGKGFARHMMRLLHWVLADESLLPPSEFPTVWGAPPPKVDGTRNGRFSALWSDVGDFYGACGPVHPGEGWVIRGTATTIWDVDTSTVPAEARDWTWLDYAGCSKLWEEDAESMRSDMENSASPGLRFSYLPTHGVASYQPRRLEMYLQRLPTPPQTWGVTSSDHTTYATWAIDPRPPAPRTLVVTRLRANPQRFRELVGKILELARKYDVKRVEMWNLSTELDNIARTLNATTHMREEHLPAFKWYGKEPEVQISWFFNERFCWC
ncbi:hypothetical protein C8F04DRAFT_1092477 [Mycena alexandri]|uniref:LYC1 C-terminal domain-containing protein n=1 Tax=Mycena alexandri TaxID=1745969 RepID=A0AAD6T521_9AGAR|nr:hypothetical protein C8F04DRAFT_1092477 [Mycena alexandri]